MDFSVSHIAYKSVRNSASWFVSPTSSLAAFCPVGKHGLVAATAKVYVVLHNSGKPGIFLVDQSLCSGNTIMNVVVLGVPL